MIYDNNCTLPKEYVEQLTEQGLEGLPKLIRVLINEAIQIERQNYLKAKPYERSKEGEGMPMAISPRQLAPGWTK